MNIFKFKSSNKHQARFISFEVGQGVDLSKYPDPGPFLSIDKDKYLPVSMNVAVDGVLMFNYGQTLKFDNHLDSLANDVGIKVLFICI